MKELDGKVLEYHTDLQDPALSYQITRDIVGDELVVVRLSDYLLPLRIHVNVHVNLICMTHMN